MAAAEALSGNRDEVLRFLKWADSWYRDVMVHSVTESDEELVNLDMLEQIREQSAATNPNRALSALSGIAGAAADVQRNLNRRMVLEKFLFDVVRGR
jgi:hypothetical protein